MALIMAVTMTAPPPTISPDPLQPFDAIAAMSEDVYTDEDFTDRPPPALPATLTSSVDTWNPIPLANTHTNPTLPWATVKAAWESPADEGLGYNVVAAVAAWANAMQWAQVPNAGIPMQLVVGIEDFYMSAPFSGQVSE